MRWVLVTALALATGCQGMRFEAPLGVQAPISPTAITSEEPLPKPLRAVGNAAALPIDMGGSLPSPVELTHPPRSLDLPQLWDLALLHNPALREASAGLEVARARQVQATRYPNPQITYEQEDLGTSRAAAGTIRFQVSQEIITCGKRRLDIDLAARGSDAASLGVVRQRMLVLTRVRRAYGDYLAAVEAVKVANAVVAVLEEARETTRKLVETAKTRPRTDLLRLDALLEEARIRRERSRTNHHAAWRELAAEVGVPDLPAPTRIRSFPDVPPTWDEETVRKRVLFANPEITQAAMDVERGRVAVERVRVEVVPNVTVGSGYSHNFSERDQGAIISIQTRLPLWDRKQGEIMAAEAGLTRAQAALQTAANRLMQETAEAYGRYRGARHELASLRTSVLPRVEQSLKLLQDGYKTGAAQITFTDLIIAQQAVNETHLKISQARRDLWRATADLQGLMALDLGQESVGGP
jgi:cobalt-zinc-cadmium efflux system outer membrane protein